MAAAAHGGSFEADNMDYGMMGSESDGTPPGLAFQQQPTEGLIFGRQFQQFPPLVTVKNTFIDGWAEEDDDRSPPMMAAKSCPAPASHLSEDEAEARPPRFACLLGRLPAEQGAKARQLAAQFLPNPSPDALPAYIWPQSLAEELRPSVAAAPEHEPELQAKAARPLPPHVTPLERRGPETSLGSIDHEAGDCRPCAWFWRPQGCNNGEACRHCHLCLQGEVKTRRKTKLVSLRKQGRAAQRASQRNDSTEEDVDGADGVVGTPPSAEGTRCPLRLTNLV